jgi:uncharacterized membrane protein
MPEVKRMLDITSLNPDLLSAFAAITAILISQSRYADELNVLGNFIVSIGSLILTEAAQIAAISAKDDKEKEMKSIRQQIDDLQQRLERM